MKIRVKTYLLLVIFAAGLIACSKDVNVASEPEDIDWSTTRVLSFDIGKEDLSSRVTETPYNTSDYYLPNEDSIGVSVENADAGKTSYSYSNIRYNASGVGSAQIWSNTTSTLIALMQDSAHVSAYHPYHQSTNPLAIPMNCLNGIDYLYAPYKAWTSSGRLYWADSHAHIKLKHAQAIIIFSYEWNGYPGAGVLTQTQVSGGAFGMQGVLNSTTGVVTSISGSYARTYGTPKNLPTTTTPSPEYLDSIYVIPTGSTTGKVKFTLTIDGTDFKVESPVKVLKSGYIYYFPLKNSGKNNELEVGEVTIIPWNTDVLPQLNIIKDDYYIIQGVPLPGP